MKQKKKSIVPVFNDAQPPVLVDLTEPLSILQNGRISKPTNAAGTRTPKVIYISDSSDSDD
jgi:hypothetical protein